MADNSTPESSRKEGIGTPDDGGPAFPMPIAGENHEDITRLDEAVSPSERKYLGMTLRDYFAAKALVGLVSNSSMPDLLSKGFRPQGAAEACYLIADAMLAARKS